MTELTGPTQGRRRPSPTPGSVGETVTELGPTNPANTLTFAKPDVYLNMNDRLHWRVKAKRTAAWRTAAYAAATNQIGVGLPPSFIRVIFPVRDNRRRDAENWRGTTKPIVDGMVDAGLWADDTSDYVIVLTPEFAKGADSVTVNISPRAAGIA